MARRGLPAARPSTQKKRGTIKLPKETALRDEISLLKKERNALNEKLADLSGQVEELRASRPLAPAEMERIKGLQIAHDAMKEQIDKLALWLRENKAQEIAEGRHHGKGGIAETVIMYLERRG